MSGTPEWLDDKGKIIEHKYCQAKLLPKLVRSC